MLFVINYTCNREREKEIQRQAESTVEIVTESCRITGPRGFAEGNKISRRYDYSSPLFNFERASQRFIFFFSMTIEITLARKRREYFQVFKKKTLKTSFSLLLLLLLLGQRKVSRRAKVFVTSFYGRNMGNGFFRRG